MTKLNAKQISLAHWNQQHHVKQQIKLSSVQQLTVTSLIYIFNKMYILVRENNVIYKKIEMIFSLQIFEINKKNNKKNKQY